MKGNFVERPEPFRPHDVEWKEVRHLTDEEGRMCACLPVGCEHQMFSIVNCRGGCGRSAKWIGVGCPFGDGQQYLLHSEAWCYWCFPRERFNEEELRLVRQAEWARKQTVDEIAEMIRDASFGLDNKEIQSALLDLESTARAIAVTREEQMAAWAQMELEAGVRVLRK